ncbi:MAG: exopolysaccharide biosynthesis protein [Candidatus Omnitrophica bacterium]|nr:exopolysaccharide biosynthesis protein [Candidatus Omnitrophota bacterium]
MLTVKSENGSPQASLGEKLKLAIDSLPASGVSLSEIRNLFGQEGLLLLTVFLVLPFMVPVSIPGVSTIFGAAILLIGVSRLFKLPLWLPKRFEDRILPADKLRAALSSGLKVIQKLERLTLSHRLKSLTSDGLRGTVNNCSFILGALLLMAPFGFVPFSNTLPGLALLFFAIGLLQRDGIFILLGHFVNLATALYFSFLIAGGTVLVQRLIRFISEIFSGS